MPHGGILRIDRGMFVKNGSEKSKKGSAVKIFTPHRRRPLKASGSVLPPDLDMI